MGHRRNYRAFFALLTDGEAPSLDALMAAYQNEWKSRTEDEVSFNKGDSIAMLNDMAARMLRVFQRSDLAAPDGTIVAIEEELTGDVVNGCPPMLARLDLAVETDEEIVITDFKTARSRWSADQVADSATQLLLYQELAQSFAGDKRIRLQFGVFAKTKEPTVEVHQVENDQHQIARTRRIVENVWNAIESERFYPAPSPLICPTCPYRGPCRQWDG